MAQKAFTDDYLLYLLAQASAEASAQFHAELGKLGIPILTWRIFASLSPSVTLTIGELARHALVNQTTLTRAIDRLEASSEVERVPNEKDRRQVYVRLTSKGQGIAKSLTTKAKKHEAGILNACSEAEIQTLKDTLAMLRSRI